MKVSYRWLSDYVDLHGYTAEELAEKLTRSGIEVDAVESRNQGVTQVVVGYVKSKEKHPDADKLNVCVVDAGQGEDLQIVCGAKNVDAGQKVPVAVVGAKLPGGMQIKRAKLRGVESQGMICSAKELGLNDRLLPKEIQEGILVLPPDTQVGESILDVLAIDDQVLELDLTPNRSDCLSMIGVAYEIAAILGREVKLPEESVPEQAGTAAADKISVEITAKDQCSHYAARYIEGIQLGPAPLWMQARLMAAGIRPINNVVDITNYVMLEYGQPLHAFDAGALTGGHIDVRLASAGETLVTLDDQERTLEPHMLLITDGTKPVGLAGVMGGANSEVSESTTSILLESAKFAGSSVRRTSRQLGLRSEASLRFEKEANPEAVIPALNRAASLMARYASGQVAAGIVEQKVSGSEPITIEITLERVNDYLGTVITGDEMEAIFRKLHFDYERSGETFSVTAPLRRGDITRDVDLIEEVARLYGYDNIPTTFVTGVTTPGSLTKEQHIRRKVRDNLTGSGLHEVINYAFTHPDQIDQYYGLYPQVKPIALAMPMSEDRAVLRTSLIPHLLDTAQYNLNRNVSDVAIFELANVFLTEQDKLSSLPEEKPMLAMLWTGKRQADSWSGKSTPIDFYDLKGVADRLFSYLGMKAVVYKAAQHQGLHPGRTADIYVGDTLLGRIGQLHPELQQARELEDTYVLEVELAPVYASCDFTIAYTSAPKYPASTRDIAVVVDTDVPVADLASTITETAGSLLESTELFDVYTGERLGAGKKSVALSLVYRHKERTLTDEEVSTLHQQVVDALEQRHGGQLRK